MMKATVVSYEKIRAEHLELRRRVARLQQHMDGLGGVQSDTEALRHWASGVAEDLVRLHEELVVHFREEEASGFFEELELEFPEHARELEGLRGEHVDLLAAGRRIVSEFLELAESGAGSPIELVGNARQMLDRLLRHEQGETTLMQRSYTEDLGTP